MIPREACPFCGSKGEVHEWFEYERYLPPWENYTNRAVVRCSNWGDYDFDLRCNAEGPVAYDAEGAIRKWDNRVSTVGISSAYTQEPMWLASLRRFWRNMSSPSWQSELFRRINFGAYLSYSAQTLRYSLRIPSLVRLVRSWKPLGFGSLRLYGIPNHERFHPGGVSDLAEKRKTPTA